MAAQVFIDGVELVPPLGSGTSAISGKVTRRLNRPSMAEARVPQHLSIGGAGSRMKVVLDGQLAHHGFVTLCETTCEVDTGYTIYQSEDPMELWRWRPCRDYVGDTPGNMIDPSFLRRNDPFPIPGGTPVPTPGPQIIEEILRASENPALIPTAAEGPLFLSYGTFEGGGLDLSGAPTNWPMTIAEMVSLLVSTGEVDVVLTPIDSGGNMASVSCYNGNYGSVTGVVFQYGMGARNVRQLRWNEDLSNVTNKIQYFFGPRPTTQRYKANITGDDPCLPFTVGAGEMAALQSKRAGSRAAYGVRMEIQEFDVDEVAKERDDPNSGLCEYLDPTRSLFRVRWYRESSIRVYPRQLMHITPIRGFGINSFGIGDRVTVQCTPSIRGGLSGLQRVYEYTVNWDTDGLLELDELVTSADQEGI